MKNLADLPGGSPEKKIEGETKMKVKSSRGIVMKLICCMALVVIASVVALSQTPKSGALITITSTPHDNSVNLKIYDSQIHTGTVRTVPLPGDLTFPGSSCGTSDQIPTDAYVLQGGAPTGCDPGDPFETSPSQQQGNAVLANFTITTKYPLVGNDQTEVCESTGNTGHVCIGGANTSVDTGFLTVMNNGSDFNGTIALTGSSPTTGGSFCPASSPFTDSFTGLLASGTSRTFALSADSSNCGGFNQTQTKTLSAHGTITFQAKDDLYTIAAANNTGGEMISFLPVPVPQDGSAPAKFSPGNLFSGDTCDTYTDLNATAPGNNPVCSEFHLSCSGASD